MGCGGLGPSRRLGTHAQRCSEQTARQQSAAVRGRQHRRQDGQRAAAGARAARLGADARPPAEAPLGPALHPAPPRGARRRCQARHHIPQGSRYPEQAHPGEVPEAER